MMQPSFFFECSGDHRDLHRVARRQRQMCISDGLRALRDNTGRDKGHLVEISHRRKLTATS